MTLLMNAAQANKRFKVYLTESRGSRGGYRALKVLQDEKIPVQMILDSAVGYIIEKCDIVLVGAEGVVESGGIINQV
jgi:translation initiation factor eIF-2B subunit alpha